MPIIRHRFQCPECECDLLEEVSRSITYSMIDSFWSDTEYGNWYNEWFDTETEDLDVIRYQCRDCGFTVHHGYTDNLYQELKRKGYILEDRPTQPQSDWEV